MPSRPKPPRVSDSELALALRQAGGIVAHAARLAGLSRRQVYRRLASSRRLAELREELREELLDACEHVVVRAALDGVAADRRGGRERELEPRWQVYWAAWLLERLGRHRGYVPPGGTGATPAADEGQADLRALERLSAAIQVAVTAERHARKGPAPGGDTQDDT